MTQLNMSKVIFDLDGVLRELGRQIWGSDAKKWNMPIYREVRRNPDVLTAAEESEILKWLKEMKVGKIRIWTVQPREWIKGTMEWIGEHIAKYMDVSVTIYPVGTDKSELLTDGYLLVEDNPTMSDYSRVVLVDKPYNADVDARRIFKPDELLEYIDL